MRLAALAMSIALVTVLGLLGLSSSSAAPGAGVQSEKCLGLACSAPGSRYDVPEARMSVPVVPGPSELRYQTSSGFYEYGAGTSVGTRAVAYVAKQGQLDRMPGTIRRLPVVASTEAEGGLDVWATIVIFHPDAALFTARAEDPQRTARRARRRARASNHGFDGPNYRCNDNYFCLYACPTFNEQEGVGCVDMVQFGPVFTGTGWHRLGDYGFNDNADSMRNRRDRDSLLAEHWYAPTQEGIGSKYCADSHSSDGTFDNNLIRRNTASAFANVPDDIHC